MASKGMSMTLTIIVAAVVILVTALVLLTIFGGGMIPIASLAEAETHCGIIGDASCRATGQLPPTWWANTIKLDNKMTSCGEVCSEQSCTKDNGGYIYICK